MNDDDEVFSPRLAAGAKQNRGSSYTSKDFQLEVLGQLAEVQALTQGLQEALQLEIKRNHEQNKLLRFDARTLVAVGAIALSLTEYVLQDARNSSKRDAEVETMKARVVQLEELATANTEKRVRMEVQVGDLREQQAEVKRTIEAGGRKATQR
ncbi:MAG TPA: hypothetical protein VMH04_19135 [Candidatus Solibacter sp.]|nr:hypothetical protein [Candidatus Solibacter sp.]